MQEVIKDLTNQSKLCESEAKKFREERNHIAATQAAKLARNYRTAANLLALVYPSKKSKAKH